MTHKNEITLTEEQITEIGWRLYQLTRGCYMGFGLKSNENITMDWHFNDGKVEIIQHPYLVLFNGYIANIDELKFLMHLLRLK
jgi:hypothetical protein